MGGKSEWLKKKEQTDATRFPDSSDPEPDIMNDLGLLAALKLGVFFPFCRPHGGKNGWQINSTCIVR